MLRTRLPGYLERKCGAETLALQRKLKSLDNLNIKGIRDDELARRGKKRRGHKPFVIECRIVYPENAKDSVFRVLNMDRWGVQARYETAVRRDQAYAALVRKEEAGRLPRWGHWEYRKRDD